MCFGVIGCSKKTTSDTFTQKVAEGAEVSMDVEHKGDNITSVSYRAVFDNKKLGITDETAANYIKDGSSFKEGENELNKMGCTKK